MIQLLSALLPLFGPPQREAAYLDPGTGSYILQLILAAIVGGFLLLRRFGSRIAEFFRSLLARWFSRK